MYVVIDLSFFYIEVALFYVCSHRLEFFFISKLLCSMYVVIDLSFFIISKLFCSMYVVID